MQYSNTQWYSVVVSILMVGFLLVLTSWVFNLVLSELNDNRGRENYLRASAGAEWALELALLSIKDQGYGHYSAIENTVNDTSVILSKDPLNASNFKSNDVQISYDMDSKVDSYSGSLDPLGFDIVPLFYLVNNWEEKPVTDIVLNSSSVEISWNIVSNNGWIAGQWSFGSNDIAKLKSDTSLGIEVSDVEIEGFLSDTTRSNNYLILFNPSESSETSYTLNAGNSWEFFTKPRSEIISSARVWKYKQNFRTTVDNTEYLNLLKYSIFSN